MNKQLDNLVRVVIIAALLILFALTYKTWQILQSDNQPQTEERTDEKTPLRENTIPQKQNENDLDQKQQESNGLQNESPEVESASPSSNDEDTITSDTKSVLKEKTPSSVIQMHPFVVIAGAFANSKNAERMKEKLLKLGYDAEVTSFSNTDLKTVLAGRFRQRAEADKLVLELEEKNIDAYVINLENRES